LAVSHISSQQLLSRRDLGFNLPVALSHVSKDAHAPGFALVAATSLRAEVSKTIGRAQRVSPAASVTIVYTFAGQSDAGEWEEGEEGRELHDEYE